MTDSTHEGWTLIKLNGREQFVENERLAVFLKLNPTAKVEHEIPDRECYEPSDDDGTAKYRWAFLIMLSLLLGKIVYELLTK